MLQWLLWCIDHRYVTQYLVMWCKRHLWWWMHFHNLTKSNSFLLPTPVVADTRFIYPRLGEHYSGRWLVQAVWTSSKSDLHINILEMKACLLTHQDFQDSLHQDMIAIHSNSMAVVWCINKKGATLFCPVCFEAIIMRVCYSVRPLSDGQSYSRGEDISLM